MESCCKVKIDKEEIVETTILTKVKQILLMLLITLIIFPIIYIYVIYMVIKQIVTGKSNKISDIASNLKDGLGLLIKENKNQNPEYYHIDDFKDDDLELVSLDKENDE